MSKPTNTDNRTIVPRVDIFEGKEGLIMIADLPGVKEGDVDLHVENNTLSLKAKAVGLAGEPVWSRSFVLPRDVDANAVGAEIHAGVLRVKLPRRVEFQPRRIEVKGVS